MNNTTADITFKPIWSSPAGKYRLAGKLAAMLPPHDTYVEPFAGSAAVLFNKAPAQTEAINDADLEIAEAFKIIKRLSTDDVQRLDKFSWVGDRTTFMNLKKKTANGDIPTLYRFLYLTHFAWGRMRGRGFSPSKEGTTSRAVQRLEQNSPRLKNVEIYGGDYEPVVRKYDSPDTVFFFNPPYVGFDADVSERLFDEHRFMAVLKSLKGKLLLTYGTKGELPRLLAEAGYNIKRLQLGRVINRGLRRNSGKNLSTLVATNYDLVEKSMDQPDDFTTTTALIKNTDPADERYVLGIVLEPEVVDAQGDIYSADEIRQAAHKFMEGFGGIGLMHRYRVDGGVTILESYLTPSDLDLGDNHIRKGTWMLAVRVLDDDIWRQVREGELTGFSIGGTARRLAESRHQEATA